MKHSLIQRLSLRTIPGKLNWSGAAIVVFPILTAGALETNREEEQHATGFRLAWPHPVQGSSRPKEHMRQKTPDSYHVAFVLVK